MGLPDGGAARICWIWPRAVLTRRGGRAVRRRRGKRAGEESHHQPPTLTTAWWGSVGVCVSASEAPTTSAANCSKIPVDSLLTLQLIGRRLLRSAGSRVAPSILRRSETHLAVRHAIDCGEPKLHQGQLPLLRHQTLRSLAEYPETKTIGRSDRFTMHDAIS